MSGAPATSLLGVLILAAGASSRMGRPKLLLPWGGSTIIGHLISQWRDLAAAQIAVVIRPDDSALAQELDRLSFPRENRIPNPHPDHGMFSSVLCAAHWSGWRRDLSRWAIALGDQPHLRQESLRKLLYISEANPAAICQPSFAGRAAHPVILPPAAFASLKNSHAENLREFLNLVAAPCVQTAMADPGLTLDLDTPRDYIQAQGYISDA